MKNVAATKPIKKISLPSLVLFGAVCLGIFGSAVVYYRDQGEAVRREKRLELTTIASNKAQAISSWVKEREADIRVTASSPFFTPPLRRLTRDPSNPVLREDVLRRLTPLMSLYDYDDVALTGTDGAIRFSIKPDTEPLSAFLAAEIRRATGRNELVFTDLYRDPVDGKIRLDFIAPLFEDGRVFGALVFSVDPQRYLYPLIQSWPTPSASAETLLVERKGNDVVFLNELRHRKGTALNLRIGITRTDVPAVQAVLGREGVFQGLDYRDVDVLSVVLPVPNTPWYMVAKVDAAEIFADLQYRTALIVVIAVVLAGLAGSGVLLLSFSRRQRLYRELYLAERNLSLKDELLRNTGAAAKVGGWEFNAATGEGTWTDEVARIHGLDPARETNVALGVSFYAPESRERIERAIERAVGSAEPYDLELELTAADGTHKWVRTVGRPVIEDGRVVKVRGIFQDITELKKGQRERETTIEILRLVNESKDVGELIKAVTGFFQRTSHCEAVGIRLKDGEDYPYYETRGFGKEFVRAENSLCARDPDGGVVRDEAGYPIHECMCGNVIEGRFDPSQPFFTEHGSFWTGSTTRLLATSTEEQRLARTRNRCHGEGYESVALIPLRLAGERFGLVQLNDRRGDMFSADRIALWERWADYVAIALSKFEAETHLRESERRYRSLFENMHNGYAYCRMLYEDGRPADFIYLDVNRAFEKQTGLSGVVGKKVSEVIPGIRENDPQLFEIYDRVARTGSPETFETYVASLSTWFDLSVYSPEREYFVAVFEVVTARKKAEEELRRSEANYRKLVENANSVVLKFDTAGRITFCNEFGRRFFGYRGDEILGRDVMAIVPKTESGGRSLETLASDILARPEDHGEVVNQNVKQNGELVWVSWRNTAIRDESGGVAGILAVGQDVTGRVRAEEEILRLNADLERRVSLRTAELESANRELEAFAYSVSHDLRAPLRAVDGFTEILLEDYAAKLDEEGRRVSGIIRRNAQRMGRLIDDLLAFSRLGRAALRAVDVDMGALAAEVVRDLSTPAMSTRTEFVLGALPRATGDPGMLRQVWVNLVANAVKFSSRRGGARVEIGGETRDGETVYRVSDNGAGFDMKYAGRLFGVFQRLHGQDEFEGTGVGLAIVKRIVERHGGRVWAEAEPDKGATFYFSLPSSEPPGGSEGAEHG